MKQGWEIKKFEDCLEKVTYTNKIQRKDFKECGNYPIVSQEQDFINGYWDNEDDLFKVEKPVVIFGDHTQVKKYVDFDFVLGADGVKIFQTKNHIAPKYFYYFLQNVELENLGYARHYRLLKDIFVSFPKSLPEQHRIVSILDQCFSAIDIAKANAEQNLKNAKEVFESYLQGVFASAGSVKGLISKDENDSNDGQFGQNESPEPLKSLKTNKNEMVIKSGWEMKKLGEVCELSAGGDVPKDDFSEIKTIKQQIPIYANGEKNNELYGFTSIAKITKPSITVSARGTIGFSVIRNESFYPIVRLIVVSPKNLQILDLRYLFYSLKAIDFKHTGTSIPQLTVPMIKDYTIPLPPLPDQQLIVRQLDALRAETQKLEAVYQKKIADLEELKKSILGKAFSGELNYNE